MPGDGHEEELGSIEAEIDRLVAELGSLRESMPLDPMEAARKAEDVGSLEEALGELHLRRRAIEGSARAHGTVRSDDVHADARPRMRPPADRNELASEIGSITDELMQIEIRMLKAEMDGDDSERLKLSMCCDSLKARRAELISRVREMNSDSPDGDRGTDDIPARLESLESDIRAIGLQVADMARDVSDLKGLIGQILTMLGERNRSGERIQE